MEKEKIKDHPQKFGIELKKDAVSCRLRSLQCRRRRLRGVPSFLPASATAHGGGRTPALTSSHTPTAACPTRSHRDPRKACVRAPRTGPGRRQGTGPVRTLGYGGVKVRPAIQSETEARGSENTQLPPPNHLSTKELLTTPSLGTR